MMFLLIFSVETATKEERDPRVVLPRTRSGPKGSSRSDFKPGRGVLSPPVLMPAV